MQKNNQSKSNRYHNLNALRLLNPTGLLTLSRPTCADGNGGSAQSGGGAGGGPFASVGILLLFLRGFCPVSWLPPLDLPAEGERIVTGVKIPSSSLKEGVIGRPLFGAQAGKMERVGEREDARGSSVVLEMVEFEGLDLEMEVGVAERARDWNDLFVVPTCMLIGLHTLVFVFAIAGVGVMHFRPISWLSLTLSSGVEGKSGRGSIGAGAFRLNRASCSPLASRRVCMLENRRGN